MEFLDALILSINVVAAFFTALYVARLIFESWTTTTEEFFDEDFLSSKRSLMNQHIARRRV